MHERRHLCFGTRRIDDADEPREHEVAFEAFIRMRSVRRERVAGQPSPGDGKCAEGLTSQRVVRLQDLCATSRCQWSSLVADELTAATCEKDVRGSLRQHDAAVLLLHVAMKRAHQLALGGERHLADARQAHVERLGAETRLTRGHKQGAFRRVTLNRPPIIPFLDGRVVGPIRHGERPLEFGAQRAIERPTILALHGSHWRVTRARERDPAARGHDPRTSSRFS